jgi:hypothetical protein
VNDREFRDGRTYVYDDDGDVLFWLPGDVPVEVLQAVWHVREKAFRAGLAAGRAAHARELRKLLDEGVEG